MATKRGNGNGRGGKTEDAMLEVLKAIHQSVETSRAELRAELQGVRGEVRQTNVRLAKLEAGFADLRGELHEGFADLGSKIDSSAARDRHLEEHVRELGERVAKLEARTSETR